MAYNDKLIEILRGDFNPLYKRGDAKYNTKSPFTQTLQKLYWLNLYPYLLA